MILVIISILLSAGIVGWGFWFGRNLFGAYRKSSTALANLTERLGRPKDGKTFADAVGRAAKSQESLCAGLGRTLHRTVGSPPLELAGQQGWAADLDHLCDPKRLWRIHASFERVQAMPGLLTGVGILCTFMGLTIGVYGLDPTDADGLTQGVQRLLGGMSMAFLTSIAGIGTALWWTWTTKTVSTQFEAAVIALEDVLHTKTFLWTPDQLQVHMLRDQTIQTALLKELEPKMHRALSRALSDMGFAELNKNLGKMISQQTDDSRMVTALVAIKDQLAHISSGYHRLSDLADQLKKLSQNLADQAQRPSGSPESLAASQSKIVADTSRVIQNLGALNQAQGDILGGIQGAATELQELMKKARLANSDIIKNHHSILAHLKRLDDHWDQYRQQLDGMLGRLEEELAVFPKSLGSSLTKVHGTFDQLLGESLERFGATIKDFEGTISSMSLLMKQKDKR